MVTVEIKQTKIGGSLLNDEDTNAIIKIYEDGKLVKQLKAEVAGEISWNQEDGFKNHVNITEIE